MSNPGPNIVTESTIRGQAIVSVSVTPSSVAAATAAEQDVTVTGVAVGDFVNVNPAATGNATAVGSCRVKSANTVAIQYINPTAGALTPGSGTYYFHVIRPYPSAQSTFMTGSSVSNVGNIPLST